MIDDLSGLEPQETGWIDAKSLPPTLTALLAEMARTYVPVMLANARAAAAGKPMVETEVEGLAWSQQTFPYQVKCVQWLRQSFAALGDDAQATVRAVLSESGCLPLIEAAI